jgi:hypothetical protein
MTEERNAYSRFGIRKPLYPAVEFEFDGHTFSVARLNDGDYSISIDSRIVGKVAVSPGGSNND